LKLVRTLPKVLKFLPSDKAKDARNFVNSLQYWLGGNQENLENLLINVAQVRAFEPVVYTGLW
jgi:magnesium chelatase subunit H